MVAECRSAEDVLVRNSLGRSRLSGPIPAPAAV